MQVNLGIYSAMQTEEIDFVFHLDLFMKILFVPK